MVQIDWNAFNKYYNIDNSKFMNKWNLTNNLTREIKRDNYLFILETELEQNIINDGKR